MGTLDIKFTKFDNRPWGFRLAGGYDFPEPLTVIRVAEESLAECMGLKVGDVLLKLNDQPIHELTHGQAHEALTLAGNNFVLTVRRAEDPNKLVESIEEKVEPYMRPIENILFDPIEEIRETTPDEVSEIKDECPSIQEVPEEEASPVEVLPDKPRDENSEKIANPNLTEEEIAQLILEEEEVLNEKGVLGVNFNKLRPRLPLLKQSDVLREIQKEILEQPVQSSQANLKSVFLKKPDRPVPKPRRSSESENNSETEGYKVVIKKQPKRSVTERLLAKGLIDPSQLSDSQRTTPAVTPSATPEPTRDQPAAETTEAESRPQSQAEIVEIVDTPGEATKEESQEQTSEPRIEEPPEETTPASETQATAATEPAEGKAPEADSAPAKVTIRRPSSEVEVEVAVTMDRDKIKELVTTEISLERQLESVQNQLMALKQLPSEIEKHLKIVSEQLHKIMELSGVEQEELLAKEEEEKEENRLREEEEERENQQQQQQNDIEDDRCSTHSQDESSSWAPHLISTEDDTWCESKELEISVKSNDGTDDGKRVKKYIVSYESKVIEETKAAQRSREPSPAVSQQSFEPDPNLTLQDQIVQELKYRKSKKSRTSRDLLWQPQAKQLELTYGRKWRCPNDFFNDEMIADALSAQAEVIRGRAMGVNFKKFEKKSLPNFDHLQNSSVYKMIHKLEAEPKKGIPARPPIVVAAEDIIERVNTPVCGMADDRRSVCQ